MRLRKVQIFSQGPHNKQVLGITAEQFQQTHLERREAIEATLNSDIHDAIEFVSMLTFKVMNGEYDANNGPVVRGVVYKMGDGRTGFRALEGLRG